MDGFTSADAFEVRWVPKAEGGNLPVLFHTDPYIPVRLPFHYLALHAEEIYAESTQGQHARTLKALYQYCYCVARIELDTILASGQALSSDDVFGFSRWLRNGRLDPVKLVGRIGPTAEGTPIVRRSTVLAYLKSIKTYLLWAADTFSASGGSPDEVKKQLEGARARIERMFSRLKMPSIDPVLKGFDKDQMYRLRSVARPGSRMNPFKDEAVQWRNWCILEILSDSGLRRGELMSALSSDKPSIHNSHKWFVRRRPPDPKDPRVPRPAVKTQERDIQLLPRHTDILKRYVDKYRFVFTTDERGNKKKAKPSHDFLFISTEDGAPLSLDAINKILKALGNAAFPNGDVVVHPHLLRNTFCNEFMEHAVDVEGRSVSAAQEELRRLCGWTLKSEMPTLYARKWGQEAADEAQRRTLLRREEQARGLSTKGE